MTLPAAITWYGIAAVCWLAGALLAARNPVAGTVLFVTGVAALPYTSTFLAATAGVTYRVRGRLFALLVGTLACGVAGLSEEYVRLTRESDRTVAGAALRADSLTGAAEAMLTRGEVDSASALLEKAAAADGDSACRAALLQRQIARYAAELMDHTVLLGLSDRQFAELEAGRLEYRVLTNPALNELLLRNMYESRSIRTDLLALDKERRVGSARQESPGVRARDAALGQMRARKDEMEGVTWYYDKSSPRDRTQDAFYLYFALKPGEPPYLRWRIQCVARPRLAVRSFLVKAGERRYDMPAARFRTSPDNDSCEWYDEPPSATELAFIRGIITSSTAAIRFQGTRFYKDKPITSGERDALRRVIDAFEAAGGKV